MKRVKVKVQKVKKYCKNAAKEAFIILCIALFNENLQRLGNHKKMHLQFRNTKYVCLHVILSTQNDMERCFQTMQVKPNTRILKTMHNMLEKRNVSDGDIAVKLEDNNTQTNKNLGIVESRVQCESVNCEKRCFQNAFFINIGREQDL